MLSMYNQYSLDGLDIDWEYPGVMGQDGNIVSSSDSANYLLFLQLLRKTLPAGAKITAATQVWPFAGTNGNPLRDVSAFAEVFDWITVMNYDVWGSSNTPGPNAPLSDGCGNSLQPLANAYGALSSWTNAGFPAKKLMLGTAACVMLFEPHINFLAGRTNERSFLYYVRYGYLSGSSATKLVDKRAEIPFQHSHMKTRSWSSRSLLPNRHHNRRSELAKRVTVVNDGGGTTDGQLNFSELIRQGALGWDNSARKWVGAGGFTRVWDSCSSTVGLSVLSLSPFAVHADLACSVRDVSPSALPAKPVVQPGHHVRRPRFALPQGPVRQAVGHGGGQRLGDLGRRQRFVPSLPS